MDIAKHVDTYSANNLRIFIHDDGEMVGFFRNPLFGWTEYEITDIVPAHKIRLRACGDYVPFNIPIEAQYRSLVESIWNTQSYYCYDFDRFNDTRARVYVLVDEDNKYERLY